VFYAFSKLVQPILWPTNAAMLLLVAMFVCFALRRNRVAKLCGGAALGILVLSAMPVVAILLFGGLERQYPVLKVQEAPVADVIVALGGTVLGVQPPRREVQEVFGSRVISAGQLQRSGKAQAVIVSSGVHYVLPNGEARSDAGDMRILLVAEGVPSSVVYLEDKSRNTDENARFSADLMKRMNWKSALLVTSAFHMPRSVALFRKYGVTEIHPFPVDIKVTDAPITLWDFVPDPGSIALTQAAIKERIGRLFY
jgi:uncharacterized SAM-binding protein YcdF (DUF218 family)